MWIGLELALDFHLFSVATVGCLVLFPQLFTSCSLSASPGKILVAGSLRKKLDGDLTLGLLVEFMPHVQFSTMVPFNEACFNLRRDNLPLPLARKKEANVSMAYCLAWCWKAQFPVGMCISFLFIQAS